MDLLQLKFVQALSSEVRDEVLIVDAKVLIKLAECPFCKAASPYRHDSRTQEFADSPIRGNPVRIRLQRQRYRCRACRKAFFEPLVGFSAKRNMTQRLVHYIAQDALIRTFADVAEDVGLDVQTVRGVFLDFSDWLRAHHPIATPRIMGIDEAKRAKVLCTVLTDLQRREYFDMLPSRKAEPLNAYLSKVPDKEKVEVVAMDLHQGFVHAIGRHMPQAVRVADKYHVARLAQNAFDKAHVDARKPLPTGERLAMFRHRGLLATRDRRLTDDERAKVAKTLAPFPLLQAAHAAKESFLAIYEAPNKDVASRQLSVWLTVLPAGLSGYFRPLITAVSNNREIILNYFTHRYTNAFTEAANKLSDLLQQTGRGYGFEVMRIKLLYGKRGQAIDLTDYDADDDLPGGSATTAFVFSKMTFSSPTLRKKQASGGDRKRRGPSFARVGRLIGEGYYDLGNQTIADELEPLIREFAATA
ncbi:ISL3 family transposase [Thermomonas brevis]